jgi:hypothetical protein
MGKSLFDLITRKPVVFVVAIVMITLLLMIGMIVKPGPTEMNEDWAPDHEAIAALMILSRSFLPLHLMFQY